MTLQTIILNKIKQAGGRITFADFMAEALYHQEYGYYNRETMSIGEHGDFYTSPMVHEIFGQCVARQIYYFWQGLGSPARFVIVEMGAGTGALARDVLTEWDRLHAESGSVVHTEYHIVEQSPTLRDKQRESTADAAQGRISWYTNLEQISGYGSIKGAIITNELFDALPVNRLVFEDGELQEKFVVAATNNSDSICFTEATGPLSDAKLAQLIPESVRSQLAEGDRVEVCPMAGSVLRAMADALQAGFILTVDYGDRAPEVHWEAVNNGGIRCYHRRTLNRNPYQLVGEQDITADVDFTLLEQSGMEAGMKTLAFSTQSEFLERLGFLDKVQELQQRAFKDLRADFELQKMLTLYLPDGLGDSCKVLIQAKV